MSNSPSDEKRKPPSGVLGGRYSIVGSASGFDAGVYPCASPVTTHFGSLAEISLA